MADPLDPFAARTGRILRLAGRIGCTEGQLYSMVIGVLFAWMVSANALPQVVWGDREPPTARDARAASGGTAMPATPPRRASTPSPGLLAAADTQPARPPVARATPPGEHEPPGAGYEPPAENGPPSLEASPTVDSGPMRVTAGGYSSASAGTPFATLGVPDGSVAVAWRAGRTEKAAYLQVAGRGPSLELSVDHEGTNTLDALAGLELCVITTPTWRVGYGDVTPDDAPTVDCGSAVHGVRSGAGDRWTFDLAGVDLAAATGVAIVPVSDAVAPEFQVVFRITERT